MEVVLIIGFNACPSAGCDALDDGVGAILFEGPFNPQFDPNQPFKQPHQNFTVTVPTFFSGQVMLSATHLMLVGVSYGQCNYIDYADQLSLLPQQGGRDPRAWFCYDCSRRGSAQLRKGVKNVDSRSQAK